MRCVPVAILALFIAAIATAQDAGPTTAPAQPAAERGSASSLSPKAIARQLAALRERDPLGFLSMDLADVTELLAQLNTREPTQPRQQQVVARLDQLIEMLQRQSSSSGSGAGGNKPRADSVIAKGRGGEGPMHDPKSGTRSWGELPPKQREQILQSTNEGFPPGYESILSSYYRRLAQENVEGAAPSSPATQPASK